MRQFCILRQGHSDLEARDCALHQHANKKEVLNREASGEVRYSGIHQITRKVQYVEVRPAKLTPTALPAGITLRAAGIWHEDEGEIAWARQKRDEWGLFKDEPKRSFEPKGSFPRGRWAVLDYVVDESGQLWQSREAEVLAHLVSGKPRRIRLRLRPRTVEGIRDAAEHLEWMRFIDDALRWQWDPNPEIQLYLVYQHILRAKSCGRRVPRRPTKPISEVWPNVVYSFVAGKFTSELNRRPQWADWSKGRGIIEAVLNYTFVPDRSNLSKEVLEAVLAAYTMV